MKMNKSPAICGEAICGQAVCGNEHIEFFSIKDTNEYQDIALNNKLEVKVNLMNGKILLKNTDCRVSTELLTNIEHIYDEKTKDCSGYSQLLADNGSIMPDFGTGLGWRTNLHQYLLNKDRKINDKYDGVLDFDGDRIVFVDSMGAKHNFEKKFYYEKYGLKYFVKEDDCIEIGEGATKYKEYYDPESEETYIVNEGRFDEWGLCLYIDSEKAKILDHMGKGRGGKRYYLDANNTKQYIETGVDGIFEYAQYFLSNVWEKNGTQYTPQVGYQIFIDPMYVQNNGSGRFRTNLTLSPEQCLDGSNQATAVLEVAYSAGKRQIKRDELGEYFEVPKAVVDSWKNTGLVTLRQSFERMRIYTEDERGDFEFTTNTIPEEMRELEATIREVMNALYSYEIEKTQYQDYANKIKGEGEEWKTNLETHLKTLEKEHDVLIARTKSLEVDILSNQEALRIEERNYGKAATELDIQNYCNVRGLSRSYFNQLVGLDINAVPPTIKEQRVNHVLTFFKFIFAGPYGIQHQKVYKTVEVPNPLYNDYYSNQQMILRVRATDKLNALTNKINGLNQEYEQLKATISDKLQDINQQKEHIDKQNHEQIIDATDVKITFCKNEISKYKTLLDNLIQLQENYVSEEKEKAMDFIDLQNGSFLGFDYYGKLVSLSNNFAKTYIQYNKKGQIQKIYSDEDSVVFSYNGTLLTAITDTSFRKTHFEYDNGLLHKIIYANNASDDYDENDADGDSLGSGIVKFFYDEEKNLKEIIDYQSGKAIKFTRTKLRAISIEVGTYGKEIGAEGKVVGDLTDFVSHDVIDVTALGDYRTAIKDKRDSQMLVFDDYGKAVSRYSSQRNSNQEQLNLIGACSFGIEDDQRAFSVTLEKSEINYIQNADFVSTEHWQTIPAQIMGIQDDLSVVGQQCAVIQSIGNMPLTVSQTVNLSGIEASKSKRLTLSLWAKASSGYIMSTRNKERENTNAQDAMRKFCIRAEVAYTDSTLPVETFESSFDYLNKGWQMVALPILSRGKEISSVTVTFDYSYNNQDEVYIDWFRLCEADMTYTEYDMDKKVTYALEQGRETIYYYIDGEKQPRVIMREDENGIRSGSMYTYNANGQAIHTENSDGMVLEQTYDDKGNLTCSKSYHKDNPTCAFYSQNDMDTRGRTIREKDARYEELNAVEYTYDSNSSRVLNFKNAEDVRIVNGYDYAKENIISKTASASDEANSVLLGYTGEYLTSLSDNNGSKVTYTYFYDNDRQAKEVNINNEFYCIEETQPLEDGGTSQRVLYANNTECVALSDDKGRAKQLSWKENGQILPALEYTYDEDGYIDEVADRVKGERIIYNYDSKGLVEEVICVNSGNNNEEWRTNTVYDKGRVIRSSYNKNNTTSMYDYIYNEEDKSGIQSIIMPNGLKKSYKYDKLKRLTGTVYEDRTGYMIEKYNYIQNADRATNLISSIRYEQNGQATEYIKYKYDLLGNITEVWSNNTLIVRYEYDSLSRLIREDNKILDRTVKYAYDVAGNLLCRTEYGFVLGEPEGYGLVTDYTYDEQRPDRLTMYNGESFSYDLIGNPLTYRDKSLAWEKGRQLKRYDGYIYGYDGYGKRISKGSTFYGYVGDRLVEERTGDNVLEYMYDETGVRSIVNNGASYYCIKNLQGDVISLIDTTGEIVVKYTYDAWGNHIATGSDGTVIYHSARGVTGGYENHIGNLNPIRYRGYYYDTETGLYYCQSRYYDPEVGRWLNADDINYLDPESLNGLNLYAYCGSNPVMRVDPNGNAWWNPFSWDWGAIGRGALSVLAVAGGVALTFVPGAQFIGAGLIITGAGGLIGGTIGAAKGYGFNAGWDVGTLIGGSIGLLVTAPQLLSLTASLTIPTGFTFGAGGLALTKALVTVPVGAMAVGTTAIGLLGGLVFFAKGSGPRMGHNQHENKQFRDAMRELGIKDKDTKRWIHDSLQGENLDTYRKLIEFIRRLLGR